MLRYNDLGLVGGIVPLFGGPVSGIGVVDLVAVINRVEQRILLGLIDHQPIQIDTKHSSPHQQPVKRLIWSWYNKRSKETQSCNNTQGN